MSQIPENKRLRELVRKYSDTDISREDFTKQRRVLLDEVDAKYNNRNYKTAELVEDIKNRLRNTLNFLKKNNE